MAYSQTLWFWLIFLALLVLIALADAKCYILRDTSTPNTNPYSWARVQLAWWTIIILSAFVSILIKYGQAPELNQSVVILLGISAATITTARIIDTSPQIAATQTVVTTPKHGNFFLDIISDDNSANIHRFQTVVFNLVFGIYFIVYVVHNISLQANDPKVCEVFKDPTILKACKDLTLNYIMPEIQTNNLVLLGLSSATYVAMKITENK